MLPLSTAVLATLASATPLVADDHQATDPFSSIIIVSGHDVGDENTAHIHPNVSAPSPDAASLVARVAGAALVGNGPISGQVQFRGFFSDRLSIHVNGQKFQGGGPNAMDPPLHYAPMILLDQISISRGTGSVKDGMGIGGTLQAELKSVDFSSTPGWQIASQWAGSARSADQSYAVGGIIGTSNAHWRIHALGAFEKGEDLRIGGGGKVRASSYERLNYGLGGGFQYDGGELALSWRRQQTGASGNPAFAMDIDFFDGDFLQASTDNQWGDWRVKTSLGFAHITHGMNNYGLRPAPTDRSRWRYSSAKADSLSAKLLVGYQGITLGGDADWIDRDVRITNPNNANFWIASLRNVQQQRFGVFAEVEQDVGPLSINLGGRLDFHQSRMADAAVGSAAPAMLANWAAQTALANRPLTDQTGDVLLRLWHDAGPITPRFTLGLKQRVGNAVERHSWMPTEASGGLADGNIYIGNANLRPEKAWIIEAGVDVQHGPILWKPAIYYRRVDDYIQGVAVPDSLPIVQQIAAMNGDATPLMFANVDAEIYGADMDLQWNLGGAWQVHSTLSYVRGKRRDIADNLYRIAPLNGRLALQWAPEAFIFSAELVGAAVQKKVSRTNDETPSPSWLIANLSAEYLLAEKLTIALGVENLWDQRAADHLSGVNRVTQSDVQVGERVPMAGRGLSLRLSGRF